jgi:hypothetical protein
MRVARPVVPSAEQRLRRTGQSSICLPHYTRVLTGG